MRNTSDMASFLDTIQTLEKKRNRCKICEAIYSKSYLGLIATPVPSFLIFTNFINHEYLIYSKKSKNVFNFANIRGLKDLVGFIGFCQVSIL